LYLGRVWLALDILLNTLAFGQVETMSSRMGKAIRDGRQCILCKVLCGLLNLRWKDHCIHNIMGGVER
jgi:hypothetical protein